MSRAEAASSEAAGRPVAIVGGGFAGLCCARRLIRGGADVRLFEAADRLGGRVASDRLDGASINGAMRSGRLAAEAVLANLGVGAATQS